MPSTHGSQAPGLWLRFPDKNEFWNADCAHAEAVRQGLSADGIKLLVAEDKPLGYRCAGWLNVAGVGSQGFHMLILARPSTLEAKASRASLSSVSLH